MKSPTPTSETHRYNLTSHVRMFLTCILLLSQLCFVQTFPSSNKPQWSFIKRNIILQQSKYMDYFHRDKNERCSHRTHTSSKEIVPKEHEQTLSRRNLFQLSTLYTASLLIKPKKANAGLVQFPCDYKLMNTYHLMRAGESILESQDILSTNPLFLTNREDALSIVGKEQVEKACRDMANRDINPSVVKYSLAAKAIDTADIIASQLQVGRNRLVPEYTFMDPRGIGLWDMQTMSMIEEAIWAMDYDEAGTHGYSGRPPSNDDSTPNETLSNQVIRLRQLMSVLETQFSGDTILLVFGDGTSPALLSCLMAGLPLNRTHELNFKPGEIRYNITKETVLDALPNVVDAEYLNKIERGRETLVEMRQNPGQFRESDQDPQTLDDDFYQPITKSSMRQNGALEKEVSQSEYLSFFGLGLLGMIAKHFNRDLQNEQSIDQLELEFGRKTSQNVPTDVDVDHFTFYHDKEIEEINELEKLEALAAHASFDIPEMETIRIKRAKTAMQEYMDKDDGVEDWLNLMNEIMHENEEDIEKIP